MLEMGLQNAFETSAENPHHWVKITFLVVLAYACRGARTHTYTQTFLPFLSYNNIRKHTNNMYFLLLNHF
jgi:hypothetical protein